MSEYKRLTYRDAYGKAWAKLPCNCTAEDRIKFGRKSLERLAEYEDIGSPEELRNLKAEHDAAVNDLKTVCTSGETCASCKDCRNMGDEFPCAIGNWCGGTKWEWRGPQED